MVWTKDVANSKEFMFQVNELEKITIKKLQGESIVLPCWNGYLLDVLNENQKKYKALEYRGAFFDLVDIIYNTKKNKKVYFIDGLENLSNIKTQNLLCFNYLNYEQYPSAFISKILNTIESDNYYFTCYSYSSDNNYSHNILINNERFIYNYFSYDYLLQLANEFELVVKSIGNIVLLYKEKTNEKVTENALKNDIIEKEIEIEVKPKAKPKSNRRA